MKIISWRKSMGQVMTMERCAIDHYILLLARGLRGSAASYLADCIKAMDEDLLSAILAQGEVYTEVGLLRAYHVMHRYVYGKSFEVEI